MTTKTETFTSTENPLSTNWDTAQNAGLKSTATGANAVNSTGFPVSIWKTSDYTFADDQDSTVTITSAGAFDYAGCVVRYAATGGGVGYMAHYESDSSRLYVRRFSAGAAAATLRLTTSFTMASGDTLTLAVAGTTLKVYKNGAQVGADIVVTGADIVSSGQPGVAYQNGNSNVTRITVWTGVDAAGGGTANPWYYYAQQ